MSSAPHDASTGHARPAPVAALRGLHHVGIPVRDIECSIAWYGRLFGFEPEVVDVAEGPQTSRIVQLEDARLRFAFMPIGGTLIELLEYERPRGRDYDLRNCDVGAIHVCFEVDDIDRVYAALRAEGVAFNVEPTRLSGAVAGHRCCYFRDPDGVQLELWERPRADAADRVA